MNSLPMPFLLLDGLLDSGIQFVEPAGLHRRAIELAGQLKHSAVYDAHYLALAEALESEMWTADERFYRAAIPHFRVRWLGDFE